MGKQNSLVTPNQLFQQSSVLFSNTKPLFMDVYFDSKVIIYWSISNTKRIEQTLQGFFNSLTVENSPFNNNIYFIYRKYFK